MREVEYVTPLFIGYAKIHFLRINFPFSGYCKNLFSYPILYANFANSPGWLS